MTAKEIFERVNELCPGAATDLDEECLDPFFKVNAASLKEVCLALRDDGALKFSVLSDLTAVDLPSENVIQIVYHLFSYEPQQQIVIKADVDRDASRIATVEGVWKVANWFEREVFDLFGVVFEGHSDLRRILLPEDWVGYPLRKDFVEQEEYDGISTEREPLVPENMR